MFHSTFSIHIKALFSTIYFVIFKALNFKSNYKSLVASSFHKVKPYKYAIVATVLSFTSISVNAQGAAGLFTGGAEELEPLTLSVVEPLAKAPYELVSGKYYELIIICDGSGELALSGAEFFRNIWIDEIVINDIEIRPMGISSFEFDDEGEMEISFIAIKPGTYTLRIPGTTGESQQAQFTIR